MISFLRKCVTSFLIIDYLIFLMVEKRITVLAALFVGMYFGSKVPDDSLSFLPPMSDEVIVTSLCGLDNLPDSSYSSFIRPAVYVVPGTDLPDPFEFYSISPDVELAVQNVVWRGVISEPGLDEMGKRRYAMGLLGLLDTDSNWSIDTSDFDYILMNSSPVDYIVHFK